MAAETEKMISRSNDAGSSSWTFFSNHSHVLISLYGEGELTLREVADRVGITERAVQKIVSELEAAEILTRIKVGRRNRYRVNTGATLRHPVESHRRVGDLLKFALEDKEEK